MDDPGFIVQEAKTKNEERWVGGSIGFVVNNQRRDGRRDEADHKRTGKSDPIRRRDREGEREVVCTSMSISMGTGILSSIDRIVEYR